jgi:hypothetical protein
VSSDMRSERLTTVDPMDSTWLNQILDEEPSYEDEARFTSETLQEMIDDPNTRVYATRTATGGVVALMRIRIEGRECQLVHVYAENWFLGNLQRVDELVEAAIKDLDGFTYARLPSEDVERPVSTARMAEWYVDIRWLVTLARRQPLSD